MGYGFGIWLVPIPGSFDGGLGGGFDGGFDGSSFIKHFTISCFMEKDDAKKLFKKIIEKYGLFLDVKLIGKHKIFGHDFYPDDNSVLHSWGYNGLCKKWSGLKRLCDPFKCCFSHTPHMSIQYSENVEELNVLNIDNIVFKCKVCLVDICSDDCNKWKILD